jgi:hypothetical protein
MEQLLHIPARGYFPVVSGQYRPWDHAGSFMDIASYFLRGLGWAKKQSAWGEGLYPEAVLESMGPGWPVFRGDVFVVFMVAAQI